MACGPGRGVISLGSLLLDGAFFADADFSVAADFFATTVFFLEFIDMLSSQDVSMRATRTARLKIFVMFRISWNRKKDYEKDCLRSTVKIGTILRRLVVRGDRIVIFEFHGNCE